MQQTSHEGGWALRSGRGQLRETRSTLTAPPAISRSTYPPSPDSTDPMISASFNVTFTSSSSSMYCEDTRPQNQLFAAQEQHKGLCSTLQGASVTLHNILLGVGGTINNNHMRVCALEPCYELGLDSQKVKKLASKPYVHSVNYAAKFVHTLSTLTWRRFQIKPAALLIPIDIILFLFVEGFKVPKLRGSWRLYNIPI